MQEKDIQIITQNVNTAAATIVAAMVNENWDVEDVMNLYGPLHKQMLDHVLGEIAGHLVQQAFPGSTQVDPQPMTPADFAGPNATGGNVVAMTGPAAQPMPIPQPAPQVVPDHQIMANATPPPAVGPQGPGGHKDDQLWQDLFQNPGNWWDNRADKKSPKHPDFRSKTIPDPKNPAYKLGLYLSSAPQWAKQQLGVA